MSAPFSTPLQADDLLTLLAVSRTGRYTDAAQTLGVSHTTVARRLAALDRALGGHVVVPGAAGWVLTPLGRRAIDAARGVEAAIADLTRDRRPGGLEGVIRLSATDGFSAFLAAPAMARLRAQHPAVSLEIVAVTRSASPQRVGADLEVVVGRPEVRRARAVHLADYALGLYAAAEYLSENGAPARLADLTGLPLVYFIESMLQVDSLDDARRDIPRMVDAVTSTNVFVHLAATRAGAGFGLLPTFLADREPGLVRVLPDAVDRRLPYYLVARPEAFDRPLVAAFLTQLRRRIDEVRDELLGRRGD